jgi:hypothetical protein
MQLPGRGYLFPGQVASVCEKRFCPIVHMTDLPIIVSDEMPGNFSTFGQGFGRAYRAWTCAVVFG